MLWARNSTGGRQPVKVRVGVSVSVRVRVRVRVRVVRCGGRVTQPGVDNLLGLGLGL